MSTAEHLQDTETWKRGFFMMIFVIIYTAAEVLIFGIVVFQFFSRLFTGELNLRLVEFAPGLSRYIYEILKYVTYESDERPFPFSDWPAR